MRAATSFNLLAPTTSTSLSSPPFLPDTCLALLLWSFTSFIVYPRNENSTVRIYFFELRKISLSLSKFGLTLIPRINFSRDNKSNDLFIDSFIFYLVKRKEKRERKNEETYLFIPIALFVRYLLEEERNTYFREPDFSTSQRPIGSLQPWNEDSRPIK